MIIACPACRTRYVVPDSAIGIDGRTVRCAKCKHSWYQDGPDPADAQAPAAAPGATPPTPSARPAQPVATPRPPQQSAPAAPTPRPPVGAETEPQTGSPAAAPPRTPPHIPARPPQGAPPVPPMAAAPMAAAPTPADPRPVTGASAQQMKAPPPRVSFDAGFTPPPPPTPPIAAPAETPAQVGARAEPAARPAASLSEPTAPAPARDFDETDPPFGHVQDDLPPAPMADPDDGYSSFDHAPPFGRRRNMARFWTWAAALFAALALAAVAVVSYAGVPDWLPIARPLFGAAPADLKLGFPQSEQERRTLPNGTQFFGARILVTNTARESRDVPDLRVILRDERERQVYSWVVVPPQRTLAPGETMTINEAVTDVPRTGVYADIGWAPR